MLLIVAVLASSMQLTDTTEEIFRRVSSDVLAQQNESLQQTFRVGEQLVNMHSTNLTDQGLQAHLAVAPDTAWR